MLNKEFMLVNFYSVYKNPKFDLKFILKKVKKKQKKMHISISNPFWVHGSDYDHIV